MPSRCLFLLAAGLALAADPAPEPSEGEAGADLARAVRGTASLENYAFGVVEKGNGPGGAVEGKYQKGQPVWFRADGIEFYRAGNVLVYRQGQRWLRSKTGVESDPLRVLGAAARVRSARLPHEELDGLEKHLKEVRRETEQDEGAVVYSATLEDEAVKRLARTEHRSVARSGTLRLWVGKDGRIGKYELSIRLQGRLGDADVNGTAIRSVTVSGVGSTPVTVPEDARKALE